MSLGHPNEREFTKCKLCEKEFVKGPYLKRHMSANHGKNADLKKQPVKCDLCDKVLKNKLCLPGHKSNMHSGVRPKCEPCDMDFINAAKLRQHVRSLKHKITVK